MLQPDPVSPLTTVILLDISAHDYSFSDVQHTWRTLLADWVCPCCRRQGRFGRHGRYWKYHFSQQIEILRLRCHGCGVTHAVLPSFSLPGTSLGTEEAQAYLKARGEGASRAQASRPLREAGMSERSAKALERMLATAAQRGKALFKVYQVGNPLLTGLAWVASVCGPTGRPLYALNEFGLAHRVNGLCFCRATILEFGRARVCGQTSHDLDSACGSVMPVDSG